MRGGPLLVVGPNFTVDRTSTIATLQPGEVLRTREVSVSAGGKGVNVVRFVVALGAAGELVTFVPGRFGAAAAAMLREDGVAVHEVPCQGEIRSTSILHEDSGRITVLNEPGPAVDGEEWDAFERAVTRRLEAAALLICSGSAPPGTPDDAYARLTAVARDRGCPAIVDASGPLLAGAVRTGGGVVTPNLAEAEALLEGRAGEGVEVDARDVERRALDAAGRLLQAGAGIAVVTAGAAGAAVAFPASGHRGQGGMTVRWFPAHRIRPRNPIGAGDAFTAGYAVAASRGADPEEAVRAGMAAAAASAEQWWPGKLDPRRAAQLRAADPPSSTGDPASVTGDPAPVAGDLPGQPPRPPGTPR